jgi:hypothetical protein
MKNRSAISMLWTTVRDPQRSFPSHIAWCETCVAGSVLCSNDALVHRLALRLGKHDRPKIERPLVELAIEAERRLVISIVDAGARIDANIESLVDRYDERDGVRDRLLGDPTNAVDVSFLQDTARKRTKGFGCLLVQSRPEEFHPEPFTGPDLILSHHPARVIARRLSPSTERRAPPGVNPTSRVARGRDRITPADATTRGSWCCRCSVAWPCWACGSEYAGGAIGSRSPWRCSWSPAHSRCWAPASGLT